MQFQINTVPLSRRDFFVAITGRLAAGTLCLAGCSNIDASAPVVQTLLTATPKSRPMTLGAGLHSERVNGTDFVYYVPTKALTRSPVPIMIILHGANRGVNSLVAAHQASADSNGVIVVAPYASANTWDAIGSGYFGPDVRGIDSVLQWLFDRVPAAWTRTVLSGFSDGATYTLGFGRANGDLFSKLIAYSPGFLLNVSARGRPPIVISHGTADTVLSYAYTRDTIVPALTLGGYLVNFITFDGPHAVPIDTLEMNMASLGAL